MEKSWQSFYPTKSVINSAKFDLENNRLKMNLCSTLKTNKAKPKLFTLLVLQLNLAIFKELLGILSFIFSWAFVERRHLMCIISITFQYHVTKVENCRPVRIFPKNQCIEIDIKFIHVIHHFLCESFICLSLPTTFSEESNA